MVESVRAQTIITAGTGIRDGHHRYFASSGDAHAFFSGKAIAKINDLSVVRKPNSMHGWNAGSCHVPYPLAFLENADYFCYFNPSLSNVWFHNKIIDVEYVNANSSRVHFAIDHYATYVGECTFNYAYLERGHIPKSEDLVSRFLMTEPVDFATRIHPKSWPGMTGIMQEFSEKRFVVFSAVNENSNGNVDTVRLSSQSGALYYGIAQDMTPIQTQNWLKGFLKEVGVLQTTRRSFLDFIRKVKLIPRNLINSDSTVVKQTDYVPELPDVRNKKCLSPQFYNFRVVAGSTGQAFDMSLLDSADQLRTPIFKFFLLGVGGTNAQLFLFLQRAASGNFTKITNISQTPYPDIDIFALSREEYTNFGKVSNYFLKPAGYLAAATLGVSSGNLAVGAVGAASAVNAISDATNRISDSQKLVSISVEHSPMAAEAMGSRQFEIYEIRPPDEQLKLLDDYFDMWGYIVGEIREIKLNVRSNFTYVKTANATVTGKAPAIALETIGSMLDSGLHVWQVEIGSTKDCG